MLLTFPRTDTHILKLDMYMYIIYIVQSKTDTPFLKLFAYITIFFRHDTSI